MADQGTRLDQRLIMLGFTVFVGADQFDQVVTGDDVPRLAANDVVDPRQSSPFIRQAPQVHQRIDDPPAGEGVDHYVELVAGGHLAGAAIPFEDPLLEPVGRLDEGDFEVEPRAGGIVDQRVDRLAHRLAELRDHHLLGLIDRVGAAEDHDPGQDQQPCPERREHHLRKSADEADDWVIDRERTHGAALRGWAAAAGPPRFKRGSSCLASSSSTIVPPSRGRSSRIVSR